MTWKPTDEMVGVAVPLLESYHYKTAYSPADEANEILIAVQPLIAAEARAKALEEIARFARSLRVDSAEEQSWNLACRQIEGYARSLIPKPVEGR